MPRSVALAAREPPAAPALQNTVHCEGIHRPIAKRAAGVVQRPSQSSVCR